MRPYVPRRIYSDLIFALSTSAKNQSIGQVISDNSLMAKLTALVTEACNVATAAGAKVNQASVMDMFKTMPAEMRSSMQKDVERAGPLQLHHFEFRWSPP